jgi:hypothetical protein
MGTPANPAIGWGVFAVALLIFGLAPGLLLALIVRLLAKDDPRRRELQAELYAVPRWERPFWVCEQLEVALRVGLFPQVSWYFGRWVWHRSKLESGLESHRRWPDSFEIPSEEDKAELRPGDTVRLMWSVKRYAASGERMWVEITHRDGDRLVGTLKNWAVFVHVSRVRRSGSTSTTSSTATSTTNAAMTTPTPLLDGESYCAAR